MYLYMYDKWAGERYIIMCFGKVYYLYFTFSEEIEGPDFIYQNTWGHHDVDPDDGFGNGPGAFRCRCIQSPPNCQPEDGYDVVLECDNTGGLVDTFCSYSHTVGTAFSDSMTKEFSISYGVKTSIKADFFELFRLNIFNFYLFY